MADTIHVDVHELQTLARDLKKAEPLVAKEFQKGLKAAGRIVAAEAKSIASGASSRIPGSIRVGGGAGRVAVRAGNANAPHAAPFEHKGEQGSFRHPVFGNYDVWVTQQAHPFLKPAEERTAPKYMNAVTFAIGDAMNSVGL